MKPYEFPKSHAGKILVPPLLAKRHRELMESLTGEHASVYVGVIGLMGPQGYQLAASDEAVEIDPRIFGPLMLQGYNFVAGKALAQILGTVIAELRNPDHAIHEQAKALAAEDTEDDTPEAEKVRLATMTLARNTAESAIRQFLRVVFDTAGMEFQATCGDHDIMVAGISQMIGMWRRLADSTIRFEQVPRPEDL